MITNPHTPHLIPTQLVISNVTNLLVELILKNRLIREGCLRVYKHIIKFILNPRGILGS